MPPPYWKAFREALGRLAAEDSSEFEEMQASSFETEAANQRPAKGKSTRWRRV